MNLKEMIEKAVKTAGGKKKLAACLGVKRQTIHNWIGGRTTPYIKYTDKLALLAGVTINEMHQAWFDQKAGVEK